MKEQERTNKIIVDIEVWNRSILAFKPEIQTMMPTQEPQKNLFLNTEESDRLNKGEIGHLNRNALKEAEKIVNKEGGIEISGWYGSILIDENDFIGYER